ncbi:hypothetical protein TEP_10865 [Stenotrophomonas sp. TEPEL]|nr:hypothetical protein TEP_10865 [Stenotrophomonas sp. TEPEL]
MQHYRTQRTETPPIARGDLVVPAAGRQLQSPNSTRLPAVTHSTRLPASGRHHPGRQFTPLHRPVLPAAGRQLQSPHFPQAAGQRPALPRLKIHVRTVDMQAFTCLL